MGDCGDRAVGPPKGGHHVRQSPGGPRRARPSWRPAFLARRSRRAAKAAAGPFVARASLLFVVLATLALTAQAQPARVVTGRVVSDATGDPLPNVRVTVRTAGVGAPAVMTDADGRFSLAVSADRVALSASKSGYGPRDVTAAAGTPIEIRLSRGAAISGRVIDQFGDAVVGA